MTEQEIWDKFIELYRQEWYNYAGCPDINRGLFTNNAFRISCWAFLFDWDYREELVARRGCDRNTLSKVVIQELALTCRLLTMEPQWEYFTDEYWLEVIEVIPEAAAIRLAYV